MSIVLSLANISTFYGPIQALRDVSLDVAEGEIVTLIGANGAGKSTLMMTICGNPRARAGTITYRGEDITNLPMHEIARREIAQSPEGRRIFARMSVEENLLMGSQVIKFADYDKQLGLMFDLFPRLKERFAQRGGTLSGGEQQMLAIARALMSKPKLLLLDEPSLGLAPLVIKQIFGAIRQLNRDNRPHRSAGRAKRQPGAASRASRLRAGQRRDHHGRHRRRAARPAGNPRRLSGRRALRATT